MIKSFAQNIVKRSGRESRFNIEKMVQAKCGGTSSVTPFKRCGNQKALLDRERERMANPVIYKVDIFLLSATY